MEGTGNGSPRGAGGAAVEGGGGGGVGGGKVSLYGGGDTVIVLAGWKMRGVFFGWWGGDIQNAPAP